MFVDTLIRNFSYLPAFLKLFRPGRKALLIFVITFFLALQSFTGVLAAGHPQTQVQQSDRLDFRQLREVFRNEGREGVIKYFKALYFSYDKPVFQNKFTLQASSSPMPTILPSPSLSPTPTSTHAPQATHMPSSLPASNNGSPSAIFGQVSDDLLGTCTQAVHDQYVTTGADGKVYRTWHPQTDPSGCVFAHEHGADPKTSSIYAGPVAFGYAAAVHGMDEPHAGFKCFVQNKGVRNDEGGIALHDAYYCFHMGTGGVGRFTERFHSLDFYMQSATGTSMHLHGLADTGEVGTICSSPRQGRTVQGLGCRIDSSYEIWLNKFAVRSGGQTIASATVSTAVFDPITVMDPADLGKTIYSWSPEAQSVFRFSGNREGYRGCDRESYTGPISWGNQSGTQTYFTDVYGNVSDSGELIQEISTVNTSQAGALTEFGSLIMAYKGGSEPQSQFKYRQSFCSPGLGLKN